MNKKEFLSLLNKKLSKLPKKEVKERIVFYSEMIDDRIEDGLTEEEAVLEIGNIDDVANQIISEVSSDGSVEKKSLSKSEIILLAIGAPLWFPLLLAAFAIAFSLYAVLWSVIISIFAAFVSLAICGVFAGIGGGIFFIITGHSTTGLALIGGGILAIGLSIFLFYGGKGLIILAKNIIIDLKKLIKKEEA